MLLNRLYHKFREEMISKELSHKINVSLQNFKSKIELLVLTKLEEDLNKCLLQKESK